MHAFGYGESGELKVQYGKWTAGEKVCKRWSASLVDGGGGEVCVLCEYTCLFLCVSSFGSTYMCMRRLCVCACVIFCICESLL